MRSFDDFEDMAHRGPYLGDPPDSAVESAAVVALAVAFLLIVYLMSGGELAWPA